MSPGLLHKDNPLRQVIVNTHSPAVVHLVPPESLLIVETKEAIRNDNRFQKAVFSWLSGHLAQQSLS